MGLLEPVVNIAHRHRFALNYPLSLTHLKAGLAARVGRADQTENLGAPRAKALDRGGQEAAPSQRAGDRPRQ